MRKILEKSYIALITIVFTLFVIIIRMDATNHNLTYFIGLIIAGVFLLILPFLLNKSKKIEARRWYLIAMSFLSISVIFKGVYYLLSDATINYQVLIFIESVLYAISIVGVIFASVLNIKDGFKKGYSISKIDIDSYIMVLNMLSFLFANYLVLNYTGASQILIDNISKTFVGLAFSGDELVRNGLLIGLTIYLIIYSALQIYKYLAFEKNKIDPDQRDFK